MAGFDELAASRREWIENVLRPWCAQARLIDLKRAEAEWGDLAGRPDPEATLWTWAWSRFPDLVVEGMRGVNETYEVTVTLQDGRTITGFPDGRKSVQGRLVLLCTSDDTSGRTVESEPFSIDDVSAVERIGS
jgi:hypothetical protein